MLECGGSENVWVQEDAFRLKHASTGYYLHHTSQVRCGGFPVPRFSFCCLWLIFNYVVVWRGGFPQPISSYASHSPFHLSPIHPHPFLACARLSLPSQHLHSCACSLSLRFMGLSPTHNFTTLIAASLPQHEYGRPIAGQKEICAFPHATRYNQWTTEVRVMNV